MPLDSGWNAQIASYGLSLYCVIEIARCSPGQGMFCCPIANTLNVVQTITIPERMTHGSQPCQSGTEGASPSPNAWVLAIANFGSGCGRQTRRNSSVAASEPREERTSVRV